MASWAHFYAGTNLEAEDVMWFSELHKAIMDGKVPQRIQEVRFPDWAAHGWHWCCRKWSVAAQLLLWFQISNAY